MYFYSDIAPRGKSDIDVWKMNGSKAYLRHYDNYLVLNFIAKNGTRQERAEVEKEILICERKLAFWEKHPNYDREVVARAKEQMLKDWRQQRGNSSAP